MDAYFLAPGAVVGTGFILGLALRRPAWTLVLKLLALLGAGLAVLAGSPTSLNDEVGRPNLGDRNGVGTRRAKFTGRAQAADRGASPRRNSAIVYV